MSKESISESLSEGLSRIAKVVDSIDPRCLIVTEEQARMIANEILSDMPENCRGLYPEDDLLAAVAYAQVYYAWRR